MFLKGIDFYNVTVEVERLESKVCFCARWLRVSDFGMQYEQGMSIYEDNLRRTHFGK